MLQHCFFFYLLIKLKIIVCIKILTYYLEVKLGKLKLDL